MESCERAVVRLAVILMLVAALCTVWEVLARQAPGSPLYLGVLPGPIAHLRATATVLALALLAAAWLMPWAYGSNQPRLMVVLCYLGATLTVGAGFYGALRGMYLVQLIDPRPDATMMFILKYGGQALLGVCLLDMSWRILLRRPPT
jgi:hypothetical protein